MARITIIDGSPHNPVTDGYICAKVRRFPERVYGSDRLLHPAVRKGPKGYGSFERASWDDAWRSSPTQLAQARETWGGESILPYSYGGSNGLLTQDTSDATLFRRLGASRLARTVCAAPTGAANEALYGKMPSVTYQDFPEARLIILWGVNPSASGIHLVPYIREAQKRGATLIVIDPRTTPLAKQADMHLAVRPGTDLPVALVDPSLSVRGGPRRSGVPRRAHASTPTGCARRRCAVDVRARGRRSRRLRGVARSGGAALRGSQSPALIRCGWGQERNRNGGNSSLAILALPAVAGKFGVRGGGYAMSNTDGVGHRAHLDSARRSPRLASST